MAIDQNLVKKTKSHQIYQNLSGAFHDIFTFCFMIAFNSQYLGFSKEVGNFFLGWLAWKWGVIKNRPIYMEDPVEQLKTIFFNCFQKFPSKHSLLGALIAKLARAQKLGWYYWPQTNPKAQHKVIWIKKDFQWPCGVLVGTFFSPETHNVSFWNPRPHILEIIVVTRLWVWLQGRRNLFKLRGTNCKSSHLYTQGYWTSISFQMIQFYQ